MDLVEDEVSVADVNMGERGMDRQMTTNFGMGKPPGQTGQAAPV